MLGSIIHFLLGNVAPILFALALILPTVIPGRDGRTAEHYLSWFLLMSIGVELFWFGLHHVFDPKTAAAYINWQVSPFQYEVGFADVALGFTAIVSFWRPFEFKLAVSCVSIVFLSGLAVGHIHQIIIANNFSPGNGGLLLVLTILQPILTAFLIVATLRKPAVYRTVAA